jgi:hypothetical protein
MRRLWREYAGAECPGDLTHPLGHLRPAPLPSRSETLQDECTGIQMAPLTCKKYCFSIVRVVREINARRRTQEFAIEP